LPAAALWWRISGSLTSVASEATVDIDVPPTAQPQTVNEPWTLDLIFGDRKPAHHEVPTAQKPVERYNIENDLDQLHTEVSVIAQAGSRSPATRYNPELAEAPDPSARKLAAAIAVSDMSVQPVRCRTVVATHSVLKGVALAAAKSSRKVLALPATAGAAARAAHDPYSHTALRADEGILKLRNGLWKPPAGTLIIVDDADHLTEEQITWLMVHAGATNTQVVLATSQGGRRGPSRYLTDVLAENLPWSADRDRNPDTGLTAVSRIARHLKTLEYLETDAERTGANLLAQLAGHVNHYRELATPFYARSRPIPEQARDVGLSL
jgi:hypothetical protein